jgi:hypothetical protein
MRHSRYALFGIGALLTLHASTALGQGNAGAWGFVNAQYNTRSSAYIYTGYGWRGAFAMAGVVNNPRSGYAELLGGVGGVVKTGAEAEHWLAFATARTGAVSFAQIYWLPKVHIGAVTSRATVKWKVPYKGSEPQKFTISPLSMTVPVGGRLAGGVAMELSAAERARTNIGTGLELRLRLPGAAVGVDALRDVTGNSSSVRLFFASMF